MSKTVKVIHRWQATGKTPCGLVVESVTTNTGKILSDGVTCRQCKKSRNRFALLTADGPLVNGVKA